MNLKAVFLALSLLAVVSRADAQQATIFPPLDLNVNGSSTQSASATEGQAPDNQGKDQKPDKSKPGPDLKQPDKSKPGPDLKQPDKQLPPPNPLLQQPQASDPFGLGALGLAGTANGESQTFYNVHMMGDFPTIFGRQSVSVTTLQTQTVTSQLETGGTTTKTTTSLVTTTRTVLVPIASLGTFNVAENESPRPQDRVFGYYNYFGDLRGPENGSGSPLPATQTVTSTTVAGSTTTTTTSTAAIPGVPRSEMNLSREVVGFEKTFLDGWASVEVRLPLLQTTGDYGSSVVGDLTLVGKYALLLDNQTGDVFTVGLALTLPTGPGLPTVEGNFRDTLIQPWFGWIYNFRDFYVQGIHSIVIPTDAQDITLMFNDVGINYWLYRGPANQFLSTIVPTLEAHVTTPLNHRSESDPLYVPDVVVVTSGMHFVFYGNTILTLGAAVPTTGPTPFSWEGFAMVNWRF